MRDNIILIGMSGAGKSTLGVLLAKALGKSFVDTDIMIQQADGRLLQNIIDSDGTDAFLKIEENVICNNVFSHSVVATGGSAVYSERAMAHLSKNATVVYLQVDFSELSKRIGNIKKRGIAFKGANDLKAVYEERLPLYEKYSDITVKCTGSDIEGSVNDIIEMLGK